MRDSLWLCICRAPLLRSLLREELMDGRQKCWTPHVCQVPALWTGGLFFQAAIWKWSRICFMPRRCLSDYSDEDTFGMQKVNKRYHPNAGSLEWIWVRLGICYSYARRDSEFRGWHSSILSPTIYCSKNLWSVMDINGIKKNKRLQNAVRSIMIVWARESGFPLPTAVTVMLWLPVKAHRKQSQRSEYPSSFEPHYKTSAHDHWSR